MLRALAIASLLISTAPAFAQAPTVAPDAQAVVNYYRMRAQQADDAAAVAAGQIATLQSQLTEARKPAVPPADKKMP
jgi:hypothetical protein